MIGGFTTVAILGPRDELAVQQSFVDTLLVPEVPATGIAAIFTGSSERIVSGLSEARKAKLVLLHLQARTAAEEAALIRAI